MLQHWETDDSLQAAHLLSIITRARAGQRMHELARRLIDGQVPEGAWQSRPALRIPPRACERPWDQPMSGPLFADPMGLFTTATAISALSKAHRVMTGTPDVNGAHRPDPPNKTLQVVVRP